MMHPIRPLESGTDSTNHSEQNMHNMPATDLVKPFPDPVTLNAETAMKWALLGGD